MEISFYNGTLNKSDQIVETELRITIFLILASNYLKEIQIPQVASII